MNTQYRQGDVLLVRFRPRQWGALTRVEGAGGRIVLAEGEATGHAHVIDSPLAGLYQDRLDNRYLKLDGPAELRHEEHGPVALEPGVYRVVRQREYAPRSNRRVRD
jgi:hypothetical protein